MSSPLRILAARNRGGFRRIHTTLVLERNTNSFKFSEFHNLWKDRGVHSIPPEGETQAKPYILGPEGRPE